MDVNKYFKNQKKIGVFLIFFCLLIGASCSNSNEIKDLSIEYSNGKATHIVFRSKSEPEAYKLYLKGNTTTAVLGAFSKQGENDIFKPVVPFSSGMSYELRHNQNSIADFTINGPEVNTEKPRLMNIYPSRDTVPENLLKIYMVFSKPMQEVHPALDFIEVYNTTKDVSTDIFLPLQNELWNKEHTELTLWLDPGRIKRDLIPNREKGQPLVQGNSYKISIAQQWQDAQGIHLVKAVIKEFYVAERDSKKPDVKNWKLQIPKTESLDSLIISFPETMDAMLLRETLLLKSVDNNQIAGRFKLAEKEQALIFKPVYIWKTGDYQLIIDSKLEDLAGNNLNHLFDKDLLATDKSLDSGFKSVLFSVK